MKDIIVRIFTLLLLSGLLFGCEKEPEELLIDTWDELNAELTITFNADMSYSWSSSDPELDPNSGTGSYTFSGDILIIESCGDDCDINRYYWSVNKWNLHLVELESEYQHIFIRHD